jgi:hypothetical protein
MRDKSEFIFRYSLFFVFIALNLDPSAITVSLLSCPLDTPATILPYVPANLME